MYRNPHRLSLTPIHTHRKLPLISKLHDQAVNSPCGADFCSCLQHCLKTKAELNPRSLTLGLTTSQENITYVFELELNFNVDDDQKS